MYWGLAVALSVSLCAIGSSSLVHAGEGGGRGRGGFLQEQVYGLEWQTSLSAALDFAKQKDGPVMAFIGDGMNDKKMVDKLNSWPQAQELSKNKMGAVQLSLKDAAGKEIVDSLKFRPPGIAFLDKNGNPMAAFPFPETVQPIVQAVSAWKTMATNVDAFFKERAARGEKYLATGRLRPAYQEFDPLTPFKGPEPLKARENLRKIEEQWMKLLEIGAKMPAGTAQTAIFKGLRKDTDGTSFAATMQKYLADPQAAIAARSGGSSAPAVAMTKPAAPAKSLAEASRAPMVSASAQRDDSSSEDATGVDYAVFRSGTDALKKAEAILKEGVADYKSAVSESMERGPQRNQLLQSARAKFEQVLTICEEAQKAGGGQALDKIMEKTSMMMYGALKYQSL